MIEGVNKKHRMKLQNVARHSAEDAMKPRNTSEDHTMLETTQDTTATLEAGSDADAQREPDAQESTVTQTEKPAAEQTDAAKLVENVDFRTALVELGMTRKITFADVIPLAEAQGITLNGRQAGRVLFSLSKSGLIVLAGTGSPTPWVAAGADLAAIEAAEAVAKQDAKVEQATTDAPATEAVAEREPVIQWEGDKVASIGNTTPAPKPSKKSRKRARKAGK